jgi:predicted ATPase/class 3 adenylate cyclase
VSVLGVFVPVPGCGGVWAGARALEAWWARGCPRAKTPEDRYASCREFAGTLRGVSGLAAYDGGAGVIAADPAPAGSASATAGSGESGAVVTRIARSGPGEGPAGSPAASERGGRAGLPGSRTITMLFTDIEGSTGLLGRLGDRYVEALSAQRALLRAEFSACGGQEMGTEGDGFFVVFESAGDAVRCCVAGQRALAGHDWPGGVALRVRMGLHSGEAARHEDGYVGMDVHRAARIAATAHGGQVVVSEATRVLAQSRLPAGVSLEDLGWHRLKDIDAPERIYQLAGPGLAQGFPPLKSLGAPTSLPLPATPLVGRGGELEYLLAVLAGSQVRLVTLTGAGGVGKTRLAIAAAASLDRRFPHGVFFVALAAVRDPGVMWKTIAGALDVDGDGAAAVTGHLRDRRLLLVLDNLEQLPGAAGVIAALVASTPHLVVLATSRGPLHLPGEHEVPVPPLPVPADVAGTGDIAASAAVRLFVQQAGMVRPGFAVSAGNAADIAAICRRLDGLPLAIELAASRSRLLTPKALLARLGSSLPLAAAAAGRPSRQQTLRATIDWSYDLLTPSSAAVLARMGVFAGGCDLDALAAVAAPGDGQPPGADPLQLVEELMDVSLITVTEGADGEPRAGMLEMIREYALEKLTAAGELDSTRRRHAEHYAAFAEAARDHLYGPAQFATQGRLEAEYDNLRAALSWSLGSQAADPVGNGERVAIGLRLAQALGQFWYQRGHAGEGRRWLERALDLAADDAGAPLARIALWLGSMLLQQGELDAAVQLFERSLAFWRDLGEPHEQVYVLNTLGGTHRRRGDLDTARSVLAESAAISRQIGNEARLAGALTNLGQVETYAGNFDRATQLLQEALAFHRKQADTMGAATDLLSLAFTSLLAGRAREARDLLSGTFGYLASSGDTEPLADVLELSACAAAELGDCLRAARLIGAAEALRQVAGMPISQDDADLLERFLAPARATIAGQDWDAELAAGRALTQEQAVTLLLSLSPGSARDIPQ